MKLSLKIYRSSTVKSLLCIINALITIFLCMLCVNAHIKCHSKKEEKTNVKSEPNHTEFFIKYISRKEKRNLER